jgi:hypothetical protein
MELTKDNLHLLKPIIIGGLAGSATRVAVWYLESLGIDMETKEREGSSTHFDEFAKHNFLNYTRNIDNIASHYVSHFNRMVKIFIEHMSEHPSVFREGLWGCKSPRALTLIKFFDTIMPNYKFIHVIRNGINLKDQWRKEYVRSWFYWMPPLYSWKDEDAYSLHKKFMYIWCKVNLEVMNYGITYMKDRYLLLRCEDMATKKNETIAKLRKFTDSSAPFDETTNIQYMNPDRMMKKRDLDIPMFAFDILEKFGYL